MSPPSVAKGRHSIFPGCGVWTDRSAHSRTWKQESAVARRQPEQRDADIEMIEKSLVLA